MDAAKETIDEVFQSMFPSEISEGGGSAQEDDSEKEAEGPVSFATADTVRSVAEDKPTVSVSNSHPELGRYELLNDAETRLSEYKDDERMLNLKLVQLDYINESRRRYNVTPVELDILASRVANKMASEAAIGRFHGHWNLRGEKPYHRYAFAGGVDHVAENAASVSSSAPISDSLNNIGQFMKQSHDAFMAETAPNDGHKKNVIEAMHTHVGLGVSVHRGEFRYYEEFVDRYLDFIAYQAEADPNEEIDLVVRPIAHDFYVYALIAYYEPLPEPLTAGQINQRGSYPDYTSSTALSLWPWEISRIENDNTVTIPLAFAKRGIYYINVYIHNQPYSASSGSTRGKIQASGLVITIR